MKLEKYKAARMEKLLAAMKEHELDAVAIIPGANFLFLTGSSFNLMERPTLLIVTLSGDCHAIIPVLEKTKWQAAMPEADTIYWQDSDGYQAAFAEFGKRMDIRRLGIEGQHMRVFEADALRRVLPRCEIVDAQQAISHMRLHKDKQEIAVMKEAIAISEAALAKTIEKIGKGMRETEVKQRLIIHLLEAGADGLAFDPIVVSGTAAADCHGVSSNERKLKKGDAVLFDFGAVVNGYNADITRTFFVKKAAESDAEFYRTVLAANTTGREIAGPTLTAHDVDVAVSGSLNQSKFSDFIVHKTGHGLGLDVHEAPQVMIGNHQPLEPGMVVTIEPGLYDPGRLGVRIEDDVLITNGGSVSLTTFPHELQLLD